MRDKIYYGACVYPELWPQEIMEEDFQHMKKLGMNLARMGEFAWATFEPEENHFDFSILIHSLNTTKKLGMDVIVCTPTPTPPIWMSHGHSERLHMNQKGDTMHHGSRQHICTNNPYFRKRATIFVKKLMEVVREYSHVIAIQLDNEFNCHVGQCFCANCNKLWQTWLKEKYKTIDYLNDQWGTDIWSQRYQNFEQVVQPLTTPFLHNSALLQNYKQFHYEKIAEFSKEQADIIHKYTNIPVTHNTGMYFDLDNELLGDALDFVSFDTYTPADQYSNFVLNLERWKYIRNDTRKTMLLETSTSYNGHNNNYGLLHESGYVEAESFANFASGSSAFSYWLFRGQRSGCEQPHGSVVSSWGDKTIGYNTVVNVGKQIEKIRPLLEDTIPHEPKVAITYSDKARSFIDVESGGKYNYKDLMNTYHKSFLDLNIPRKMVPENHQLKNVEVLFTPFAHNISELFFSEMVQFVKRGGTWIAGPMTADRTEEHTWPTDNGLGKLSEILGLTSMVQYFVSESDHSGKAFGKTSELSGLSNLFEVESGTKVLGSVTTGMGVGKAFLIEKQMGKGKIVYLGSQPDEAMMKSLITSYAGDYRIDNEISLDDEIVAFVREKAEAGNQYWLVNFSNEEKSFELKESYADLLNKCLYEKGRYKLKAFECAILTKS